MKTTKIVLLIGVILFSFSSSFAQSMSKKYKTVKATVTINAPADKVWQAMVKDYGAIGNFSPYIFTSDYIEGSLEGKVGAKRLCTFNEKGTQWVHETIKDIDEENRVMRNVPIDGGKFPLDFDNSQAYYRVVDNGDGTTTASYEFQFRMKPAFMGAMAKGGFKKQLGGTLVGLKHYVETGEVVNANNGKYKEIKLKYPAAVTTD